MRHFITISDVSPDDIKRIFAISADLKEKLKQGVREPLLAGRMAALLFEKQSLRTRVSFETGMCQLGGGSMFLGDDVGWGKRESIADFSRVLSEMVDVVVCRAHAHGRVEELAKHSACPVINGLTELDHPCQALADLFTLHEVHGDLAGKKLAYVGDANNVARSLAAACAKLDVKFSIAAPDGYQFHSEFLLRLSAGAPSAEIEQTDDPLEAVKGAHAVYTDVWTSMGQEGEREQRRRAFAAHQVNAKLMAAARDDAVFLHCLPAHRGEEVTDEVIDGAQSAVIQQAANRLHAQKGLLVWLLSGEAK